MWYTFKVMYMYKSFIKRILDVVFSLVLIILLLPLFLIISLLIKLEDGGPVFYKQKRIGYKNKEFTILKFRSMNVMDEKDELKVKQDTRITKVGKFLRKTSFDELPQLFNILWGEMSFIGPRPWTTDLLPYYTENQKRRHDVKPGITGLAQTSGRNSINILERIKYDLNYVESVNFINDFIICFKTFELLFSSLITKSNEPVKQGDRIDDLEILKNQWKNIDDNCLYEEKQTKLVYN